MHRRESSRKKNLLITIIIFLILGAGLFWLIISTRCGSPQPSMQPTQAPAGTSQTQPTVGIREEQEVTMSRAEIELERVIDTWCEAEAGTYDSQNGLEELWVRKHQISPPYNPRGIIKLISTIRDNELFGRCDTARRIGRGHFVTGGAIQKVGDLNDFLGGCGGD